MPKRLDQVREVPRLRPDSIRTEGAARPPTPTAALAPGDAMIRVGILEVGCPVR